jgi:hypothetical protein
MQTDLDELERPKVGNELKASSGMSEAIYDEIRRRVASGEADGKARWGRSGEDAAETYWSVSRKVRIIVGDAHIYLGAFLGTRPALWLGIGLTLTFTATAIYLLLRTS